MNEDNDDFLQQMAFDSWRDVWAKALQAAALERLAEESERIRKMREASACAMIYNLTSHDAHMNLKMTLEAWRKRCVEQLGLLKVSRHVTSAQRNHDLSLQLNV